MFTALQHQLPINGFWESFMCVGKLWCREVILLCLPGSSSCLVMQEVCKHDLLVAASKIAMVCVAGMSKQPLALRFPLQSLWPNHDECVCVF